MKKKKKIIVVILVIMMMMMSGEKQTEARRVVLGDVTRRLCQLDLLEASKGYQVTNKSQS